MKRKCNHLFLLFLGYESTLTEELLFLSILKKPRKGKWVIESKESIGHRKEQKKS